MRSTIPRTAELDAHDNPAQWDDDVARRVTTRVKLGELWREGHARLAHPTT